ncbi:tetraspanin-17 isoform X1 [Brachyhypopomus gauderio]|uniref:tetraspanin-17 isoform X1 n=1 Tax=Brachyhypopomus gauderio TaxID=698409 RepID=UPI004042BBD7
MCVCFCLLFLCSVRYAEPLQLFCTAALQRHTPGPRGGLMQVRWCSPPSVNMGAALLLHLPPHGSAHFAPYAGVLSNISSITDLGGFDPVWLFIVVGGVMFILGFAGCIGALRENTLLLKFFSVFLGLIFFLELTAGILAFVFKDWIKDQLNFFINNNVKAYRDDIDLQNLIDFAQEYWSCCGAHGPNDWNLNIYFNCTELNPSRERCGVPFSCCIKDPAEDVLNTQCGYDVRLEAELSQQKYINTKGCVGQFEKWLQDNLIVVAGVFVGVALLQIFGICLAQNLVSDIKAVKANW